MTKTADGKWIVLENGRQVSGPFDDRAGAVFDADRRKKLNESKSKSNGGVKILVEVKQILHG